MKKNVFVLAVAALMAVSCGTTSTSLVILHVNDTHSHHEAMRSGARKGQGGVIERTAIIDSVRNARGQSNVLLVHAGDFNQGTSYYTTFGGLLEVDLVNAMGYDCITLGNHEFDNGLEDLAARVKKIKCPVLCANVDFSGTPLDGLIKPYATFRRGGLKIGVVGATSDLAKMVSASIAARLTQLDNVETVNYWSKYLRSNESCDMVIFLSHLGYQEDQDIVPSLHGVDIVIGGHSHTFVDGFVYVADADGKQVPVITDGCWGYDMGEVIVR
ncbi:MAG: metallophosphoesterase [Bacteroidales bacterium]|nr:metallophosphoesterase [Bacteroidales bacterium]